MDRIAGMTLIREPEEPGIIGGLVEAHSIPGFEEAVADYDGDGVLGTTADALTAITRAAARAFVAHSGPAIAMVHSLTGPAAVQLALPHLPRELHEPSLAMSWKVSASIVGAFAGPTVPAPDTVLDVDELVGSVVELGDEHMIKMCEACLRENARHPDAPLPRAPGAGGTRRE